MKSFNAGTECTLNKPLFCPDNGETLRALIVLGFLAGFIGLLSQAFVANTFIIVRIMEPFWFLAAIVMILPEIQSKEVSA